MDFDVFHMVDLLFFRRGLVTAIDVLLTQNVVFVVIYNLLIDRLYMPVNR